MTVITFEVSLCEILTLLDVCRYFKSYFTLMIMIKEKLIIWSINASNDLICAALTFTIIHREREMVVVISHFVQLFVTNCFRVILTRTESEIMHLLQKRVLPEGLHSPCDTKYYTVASRSRGFNYRRRILFRHRIFTRQRNVLSTWAYLMEYNSSYYLYQ